MGVRGENGNAKNERVSRKKIEVELLGDFGHPADVLIDVKREILRSVPRKAL